MACSAYQSLSCCRPGGLCGGPLKEVHPLVRHHVQCTTSTSARLSGRPCCAAASQQSQALPAARADGTQSSAAAAGPGSTAAMWGEQQASTHAASRTAATLADAPFASLSRILLVNQPGSMFRNLASRKWPSAFGPISLLVFIFGTIMALFAAVRSALVRKVKACRCCKGFGVVRCRLCEGRGTVDWRAKFSYSEMCPLCASKRFVVCPDCGGHYHRRLFCHNKSSKGMEAFMPGGGAAAAAASNVTQRSTALD